MSDRRRRSVAVNTAVQLQHQLSRTLLKRNNKIDKHHPQNSAKQLAKIDPPQIDWEPIRMKSFHRGDSYDPCAICQEQFSIHPQILLTCSHTFHQACLKSYERFVGRQSCPLCRCADYSTTTITDAKQLYRNRCAVKLQAWWRCQRERLRYREHCKRNPPKDPRLRQRFFQNKVQHITDRLTSAADIEADNVRNLVQQLSSSMSAIRMVFDQIDRFECEHSLQLAEILSDDSTRQQHNAKVSPQQRNEVKQERVDWNAVYQQACERDFRECPICMTSLTNSNNSRMIALLSCGHVYHGNCIGNFEKFRSEDGSGSGKIINNTCPCCRQFYQKRLFDSIMLGLQSVE